MAPPLHKAIQDPKKFSRSIDAFIKQCEDREELATIVGLALFLGCDKDSLNRWVEKYSEVTEHDPDRHIYGALKKVKAYGESQLQQKCYSKNAAMSLALGKCMFGWVEQQHVKVDAKVAGDITVVTGVPDLTSYTE